MQEGADEDVNILLVGNKSDRAERQIKIQEAENLAKVWICRIIHLHTLLAQIKTKYCGCFNH